MQACRQEVHWMQTCWQELHLMQACKQEVHWMQACRQEVHWMQTCRQEVHWMQTCQVLTMKMCELSLPQFLTGNKLHSILKLSFVLYFEQFSVTLSGYLCCFQSN